MNRVILKPPSKIYLESIRQLTYSSKWHFSLAHAKGAQWNIPILDPVSKVFQRVAQQSPNNMALHSYSQNISFTYAQFYQKALGLATGLIKELKLKPKDRIGIYSYNNWQWYVVQMAAALADLILVNINPAYQSEELSYTLNKVDLKVLILNSKFKHSDYIKIVRKIVPELAKQDVNPWSLKINKFPHLRNVVKIDHGKQTGFLNLSDLFRDPDSSCLPKPSNCNDPANIQFTSGTTGLPKAATLSHLNILNNGYAIGTRCRYTQKENIAVPVPFYHCFGMIMGNMAALTRSAAVTLICQGFDSKKTLEAVTKYKTTSIYGVPTMFIQYLREYQNHPKKYDISSLRTGIIAGSLAPQILMTKILDVLKIKDITNCYGMTQTSPVSFQTRASDSFHHKTTSVGTILDGLEAKIVDCEGKTVNRGQTGEFMVKGWAVMLGYWGDQQITRKSIIDGWMKSGDQGVIDKDGYLSIVGRIKDMIIRGGQNVYPKQIEDYLRKIEGVIDVQVIGVPDSHFGQEIAAIIKVPEDSKITKDQVKDFCKGNIAHYKIPKYVKFVHELPLTVTGKPQKFVMRKDMQQEMRNAGLEIYKIR